jgi:hypothetical protein
MINREMFLNGDEGFNQDEMPSVMGDLRITILANAKASHVITTAIFDTKIPLNFMDKDTPKVGMGPVVETDAATFMNNLEALADAMISENIDGGIINMTEERFLHIHIPINKIPVLKSEISNDGESEPSKPQSEQTAKKSAGTAIVAADTKTTTNAFLEMGSATVKNIQTSVSEYVQRADQFLAPEGLYESAIANLSHSFCVKAFDSEKFGELKEHLFKGIGKNDNQRRTQAPIPNMSANRSNGGGGSSIVPPPAASVQASDKWIRIKIQHFFIPPPAFRNATYDALILKKYGNDLNEYYVDNKYGFMEVISFMVLEKVVVKKQWNEKRFIPHDQSALIAALPRNSYSDFVNTVTDGQIIFEKIVSCGKFGLEKTLLTTPFTGIRARTFSLTALGHLFDALAEDPDATRVWWYMSYRGEIELGDDTIEEADQVTAFVMECRKKKMSNAKESLKTFLPRSILVYVGIVHNPDMDQEDGRDDHVSSSYDTTEDYLKGFAPSGVKMSDLIPEKIHWYVDREGCDIEDDNNSGDNNPNKSYEDVGDDDEWNTATS